MIPKHRRFESYPVQPGTGASSGEDEVNSKTPWQIAPFVGWKPVSIDGLIGYKSIKKSLKETSNSLANKLLRGTTKRVHMDPGDRVTTLSFFMFCAVQLKDLVDNKYKI